MTTTLCVTGHTVPDRHRDGCTDPTCAACLPAHAAPGSRACAWHERQARRALAEIPALWADLRDPHRGQASGGDRERTEGAPAPQSDARRKAASAIRACLVSWCIVLAEDCAITMPDERAIAATTHQLATDATTAATEARQSLAKAQRLARAYTRDHERGTVASTAAPGLLDRQQAALRARITELDAQADTHRTSRATDSDVIGAICEHITRQLDRLLSGDHAERLIADLLGWTEPDDGCTCPAPHPHRHEGITATARRLTSSGGRQPITVPCPSCPARVRLVTDEHGDVTCTSCGDTGDLRWWRSQLAPKTDQPMHADELAEWLESEHRIKLSLVTFRAWAMRGKITRLGRDDAGRTLYDPVEVAAVAIDQRSRTA